MIELIRSLAAPLFSLVLLIMGSGLFNTFVSVRLELEGHSTETIGLVVSALNGGILLGSIGIDRWISRVGHIKAMATFSIFCGALCLFQSFWINPWYWAGLRLFGGIAMAGIFIAVESWLLLQSTPKTRGIYLSLYLAVFYCALTMGQFLFNLSDPAGSFPFYLTTAFCFFAAIPLLSKKTELPKYEVYSKLNLLQLFRISPLGFLGGIVSGMVLAVIYGLVPVYAKEIGLSTTEIGYLMAAIIFGGLSLQWPIGQLADRGNRKNILILSSLLSALMSLCFAFSPPSFLLLLLVGAAFGGVSFTLYPLSMGYTCDKLQEGQILSATGGFVLSYGIGAISGPLLAPLAMNCFGTRGLFFYLCFISLLLTFLGIFQSEKKNLS